MTGSALSTRPQKMTWNFWSGRGVSKALSQEVFMGSKVSRVASPRSSTKMTVGSASFTPRKAGPVTLGAGGVTVFGATMISGAGSLMTGAVGVSFFTMGV